MVSLFDKDGNVIRTFQSVVSFDHMSVTFDNNGYTGKIYADSDNGEYIDDPSSRKSDNIGFNDIDASNLFSILRGESE